MDKELGLLERVNRKDVECLNDKLTVLIRFANQTRSRLDKLDAFARDQLDLWKAWSAEWDNCVPIVPVPSTPGTCTRPTERASRSRQRRST